MTHPIPDSYWVSAGALLAGEYPGATHHAEARQKLEAILDAGVRSFVDLTESNELRPYDGLLRDFAAERGLDVRYRRMSVADLGIPTADHMHSVLRYIADEIAAGRPAYLHCWGGIGRTGTVVGCWMMQTQGQTAAAALARIADLRRGTPDGGRDSPETEEQRQFVRDWMPARQP
jgi:protein-tyrosine phosphatase